MNSRMNDFGELQERANEEAENLEHRTTCQRCGDSYDERMLHTCTVSRVNCPRCGREMWKNTRCICDPEHPEAGERCDIVRRPFPCAICGATRCRHLGNEPVRNNQDGTFSVRSSAVPPIRPVAQRGVGLIHDVRTCDCLACAHRRVDTGIAFHVNCAGCGQLKSIGSLCPCGYTAEREARAGRIQEASMGAALDYPVDYTGILYGHPRSDGPRPLIHFDTEMGSRTGRMSSEPNQQTVLRDYSDLEARVIARLYDAEDPRLREAAERILGPRPMENSVPTPEVRNVPCEVCGRVERILASMVADGTYTCRYCREAGQQRGEHIREELLNQNPPAGQFAYDARCARTQCSRTSQRFNSIAAAREYVLTRNRVCPACHCESLGVVEVDVARDERRRAVLREAQETLRQALENPQPRPRQTEVQFTPAERESPAEMHARLAQERANFQRQMEVRTGRAAQRLEEERRDEERARNTFKPGRKLDLD